jgi:hypothetical protein
MKQNARGVMLEIGGHPKPCVVTEGGQSSGLIAGPGLVWISPLDCRD